MIKLQTADILLDVNLLKFGLWNRVLRFAEGFYNHMQFDPFLKDFLLASKSAHPRGDT